MKIRMRFSGSSEIKENLEKEYAYVVERKVLQIIKDSNRFTLIMSIPYERDMVSAVRFAAGINGYLVGAGINNIEKQIVFEGTETQEFFQTMIDVLIHYANFLELFIFSGAKELKKTRMANAMAWAGFSQIQKIREKMEDFRSEWYVP
jgi:hypothetical protein